MLIFLLRFSLPLLDRRKTLVCFVFVANNRVIDETMIEQTRVAAILGLDVKGDRLWKVVDHVVGFDSDGGSVLRS